MIDESLLEQNESGLWELGVFFPIENANMERFELTTFLSRDIEKDNNEIYIENNREIKNIEVNTFIFIGPSTNQLRDVSNNLLYYDNSEIFYINAIEIISNYEKKITLSPININSSICLENSYLKGDSITIKGIAKNWKLMNNSDFSDIETGDRHNFLYKREDTIDKYKGFSQCIINNGDILNDSDVGIVQYIDNKNRSLLNRIENCKVRISEWLRVELNTKSIIQANTIDEIIAGEELDGIDEGIGIHEPYDIIDESYVNMSNYITPFLRIAFYSGPSFNNLLNDYYVSTGEITDNTINLFIESVITIPENSLSAKIAAYARFYQNICINVETIYMDNIVLEHCVGTSKENEGYYEVDSNPDFGLNDSNKTTIGYESDLLGIQHNTKTGDPNSRSIIHARWGAVSEYFIEDMKIFEKWNMEGYPIVLRTKMPAKFPYVLFCNFKITNISYLKGSAGTRLADIEVEFEEVAV